MAHGIRCDCKRCFARYMDALNDAINGNSGSDSFSKDLPDGTTIYGPKSTEGRPGHKHGHKGDKFSRTPHSSVGSTAIGKPHGTKDHPTDRK